MDQLAYADNFFSLVSDWDMVVEDKKDPSRFRCKLFKSDAENTGNFCGTRTDFIAKKHQLKSKMVGGRRLLQKKKKKHRVAKLNPDDGEEEEEPTCKTKFIDLKNSNGNGFGVYHEKYRDTKEITLDKVKNVVIRPSKGSNTNFQVDLKCRRKGKSKEERQVCQCESEISLPILVNKKKTDDCVYKLGPRWEVRRCNSDRRRRLLHRSNASC